jgi:hypothetical protein
MIWSALAGLVVGLSVALRLMNDPSRFLPILRPFGGLGFIFGNLHQGSYAISVAAVMATFAAGGAVSGALCAFAASRVQRWIR